MKKKNFIWVSALCACLSMGFVSCDDEDDPISADVPSAVVTGLSFTDENETLNMLSGTLSWTAPASVENVTKYVIYASSSATVKTEKLGEVNVGTNSFTLTDVTNLGYLLVFAANELGEAEACASIEVVDNEGTDGSIFQLYFLNSGNMGNNNATLTMYDPETGESDPDYFMTQNGRGLGDTAQDIIVYGEKMYISVYGESTIEVTDLRAKSIKQIRTEGQPRYMVADGGKVYVTYYNGYVARLDTASLEVEATVPVGRNPEQLAIANNKIYVANSGGMDASTSVGYDNTVSVIDIPSFAETKKLDVVLNPGRVQVDDQGYVYVVSIGNYGDIPNTLQRIDSRTDEVSVLEACPNATEMAYLDGVLYTYYSQYDAYWNTTITFTSYNTTTGATESWIKDGTTIAQPYSISAAGINIYVAESDYTNNGDVYGFGTDGKLLITTEAGLNPMKVVLAQKDDF